MPDLTFLFGPPNIEKLKTNKDLAGLSKALTYTRDAGISRAAAAALLSLDAYLPAYESLVKTGGAATADLLEADLIALMNQPNADFYVHLRAAKMLAISRSDERFRAAAKVLLGMGQFDWLHAEMERTAQPGRIQFMQSLAQETYAHDNQPLRLRAWAAGYLLRLQEEPYATFLLENYQALFERLKTIFTYEDVIKSPVPLCKPGNLDEPYRAFIACAQGLVHLPDQRLDALRPFIQSEKELYSNKSSEQDYLTGWTVNILRQNLSIRSTWLLVQVLTTNPNVSLRIRAKWALFGRDWAPMTMEQRLAWEIASEKPWISDEIEALGIEAIPAIEAALKMPFKTGGRERDGREKRDDYHQLRFALDALQRKVTYRRQPG